MTRAVKGTSYADFKGDDLTVSWAITPGRPQALNIPAESDEIEIEAITVHRDGIEVPCPDNIFEAFISDQSAIDDLMEKARSELCEKNDEAPCPEI